MQIRLRAGDVLIFRGDLVHVGAALKAGQAENVRVHAYLDVDGVVRPKHMRGVETYFMCDAAHVLPRD